MRAVSRFLSILLSGILVASAGPARAQCVNGSGVLPLGPGGLGPAASGCDLPHNELLPASVSLAGLKLAAPFLDALANGTLDDATLNGVVAHLQAVDPTIGPLPGKIVGPLLDKIVSCALGPGQNVMVAGTRLDGQLGLCARWLKSSLSSPEKPACLQRVSACVLARVNAIGARVILSLRASDSALPLRDAVPVEDRYRESHGTSIPSFQPCTNAGSQINCGFWRGYVGRCAPTEPVEIAAKPAGTRIRVCKGLYGCEKQVSGFPPPPVRAYAGLIRDGLDTLRLTCPVGGYYSVMVRPKGTEPPSVTVKGGVYPADEKAVFTFAEGAFYGDLFETNKNQDVCGGQILTGDENACFSRGWTSGVDQMNDRFCNLGTGSNCFQNQPMPCFRNRSDDRCATDAVSGKAFSLCKSTFPNPPASPPGSQAPWKWPLTTYLNSPCDLSSDPACDPERVFHPRDKDDGPYQPANVPSK
jgi:hypothetical protein